MFNPKENLLDQQLAVSGLEMKNFLQDLITGGAYSRNKHAREVSDLQNEYTDDLYKFEGKELDRSYDYAVEGLEIKKSNDLANLQFQADSRQQEWNFGMAIRDFNHAQDLRTYEQSKDQYLAQKGFNEVAENFSTLQQDRYLMEQKIALQFDKQETMLAYTAASHGLQLQKKKTKAAATQQMRELGISALKAKGQSAARGQAGRAAAKNMNAIMMEADAKEADLIQNLIYDTAKIDMDLLVLNQQKLQDDLAASLTENNLMAADTMSRQKIKMARVQADINAEANLMLKPEIAPPLPKPLALPLPEYQDVYKPKQGPKPPENVPFQENIGTAIFGQAVKAAQFVAGGLTVGTGGNITGFNLGKAFGVG